MASSTTIAPACPRCSSSLVEIRLDQAGRLMVMRSCSTCDTRWWQRDGEDVALRSVLDIVASTKKAPRAERLVVTGAG
jgi:hypothetical protein